MTDIPNPSPDAHGYILDAENAAEMARLMLQDHLLTQSMGGPLSEQTDLSLVHRVLDVACGPGGWLFDLVKQHPHMKGVGIDISRLMIEYASNLTRTQGISNVEFRVMDATQPLDFSENTFDLVNARILTGFLSTQQWSTLLSECYRITRPGGILRLTEVEWGFTNSAALDAFTGLTAKANYLVGHAFSPSGRTVGTTPLLRLLLRRAGYEDIQQKAHVIDFSTGTLLHESGVQNNLIFYKLIQPFLVQMQLATQEELEHLHTQMETELHAEDFCGIDYYLTVWGSKSKKISTFPSNT